jgi:hypothetical protein
VKGSRFSLGLRVGVLLAGLSLLACGGGGGTSAPTPPPGPSPTPTSVADALKVLAEGRYLPQMSETLAALVRQQAWFVELDQAHFDLIASMETTERVARSKGVGEGVPKILQLATEQAWHVDGFDANEAIALKGLFDAYTESLSDQNAPLLADLIGDALRNGLLASVPLPESGNVAVIVSAKDQALGRQTLDLAVEWMPRVEELIGKFPYTYLFITVTDELPEFILGASYDEFIAVATTSVDPATVVHEIAHSTLYGKFPTWFEEGFAYFLDYYLTSTLEEGEAYFRDGLASLGLDTRLDLTRSYSDYLAESAEGYIFLTGVYRIRGIEGLVEIVRSFRTKTFGDQDLFLAIIEQGSPEERDQLRQLVCEGVIGARRDYCSGG